MESLAIYVPPPPPGVLAAIEADRAERERRQQLVDDALREMRARQQRRTPAEHRSAGLPDDGGQRELAASLIEEFGFAGAVERLLTGKIAGYAGLTNGHHPDERSNGKPLIEHSACTGHVLSVR